MLPPHKQRAQAWARELFALDTFYIIDTETTGMGRNDEVVQVGIINQHGETVFESFIRASAPITAGASRVNGISEAMLADAPAMSDVYVQLSTLLGGAVLVAYNMDFDWRMLAQSTGKYGLPAFRTGKRHCAMQQYARWRGQRNHTGSGYRWHKLTDACRYHRIKLEKAHSAVGDARMTLALMQRMAR